MYKTYAVSFGAGKEHIYSFTDELNGEEYINNDFIYPLDVVSLSAQQLVKCHPNPQE